MSDKTGVGEQPVTPHSGRVSTICHGVDFALPRLRLWTARSHPMTLEILSERTFGVTEFAVTLV